jgi:quinolinate synthase
MAKPFPSLLIRAQELVPQGAFAEAQAEYLRPDPAVVSELDALLRERNAGIVAHFYMDPELQGVLMACSWPHIRISDSLKMADAAVNMAEAGVKTIFVLGVDFMSENVRAMLDASGHESVEVFRVAKEPIGCSLAESAETTNYGAYLTNAARTAHSLHVIYVNTSLKTKAQATALVPTITCTSSNVVATILQAAAQVPDLHVWYGPDTYMGKNLLALLRSLVQLGDEAILALHPNHDTASVRSLTERFHYFEQGICIVHHMFGADVARRVREDYPKAYVTAHLEVPGEMFTLGLQAQAHNAGVVGSTSNILDFIRRKVGQAIEDSTSGRLQFILGTEAGMITPIVHQVRDALRSAGREGSQLEVEVVFPVASEAIAQTNDEQMPIVPGVAAGEGCTVAGGCATCPFMKMNSLDALVDLMKAIGSDRGEDLSPYHPKLYTELVAGRTAAELGGRSILHMRHFQREGRLSDGLVQEIVSGR